MQEHKRIKYDNIENVGIHLEKAACPETVAQYMHTLLSVYFCKDVADWRKERDTLRNLDAKDEENHDLRIAAS